MGRERHRDERAHHRPVRPVPVRRRPELTPRIVRGQEPRRVPYVTDGVEQKAQHPHRHGGGLLRYPRFLRVVHEPAAEHERELQHGREHAPRHAPRHGLHERRTRRRTLRRALYIGDSHLITLHLHHSLHVRRRRRGRLAARVPEQTRPGGHREPRAREQDPGDRPDDLLGRHVAGFQGEDEGEEGADAHDLGHDYGGPERHAHPLDGLTVAHPAEPPEQGEGTYRPELADARPAVDVPQGRRADHAENEKRVEDDDEDVGHQPYLLPLPVHRGVDEARRIGLRRQIPAPIQKPGRYRRYRPDRRHKSA